MQKFIAKRIRFRNGERLSVLQVPGGLPVHEVTLFLERFRRRGRAANTIHAACSCLALLYRELSVAKVDLLGRLQQGRFLALPELERLASAAQYRVVELDTGEEDVDRKRPNVIHISRIGFHRSKDKTSAERSSVDVATQATRIRYIAEYLNFLSGYIGAGLPMQQQRELERETSAALGVFRVHAPRVSNRAKLDARVGLSVEEQEQLLSVVHPASLSNPWKRGFVRQRNWLIVVLLLATGMRRGELLGLQIGDLNPSQPKLRILRRADSAQDIRRFQPNTKTHDREVELTPAVMKALWSHINIERRNVKAARRVPQIFVSDEGAPLSIPTVHKLFIQLRKACPGLAGELTSHVLRHTWNERFSEQAEALGISPNDEERARNTQQGWSDNSAMAATYTRRRTAQKGREISLKLQEKLDEQLDTNE